MEKNALQSLKKPWLQSDYKKKQKRRQRFHGNCSKQILTEVKLTDSCLMKQGGDCCASDEISTASES